MYHFRFYIDKEITQNSDGDYEGGDHSRVIDIEADEMGLGAARRVAEELLEPDEVIGNMSQVTLDNPGDIGAVGLHMNASGEPGRWVERTGEDSP